MQAFAPQGRMPSRRFGARRVSGHAVRSPHRAPFAAPRRLVAALVLAAAAVVAAPAAWAAGSPIGSCPGTGDKPQSKIWYNDGFYWAVLETSDGSHFFKLVDGDWIEQSFIDSHVNHGADGHEDVLWNGQELFVLVHAGKPSLYKYTYDSSLDVYDLAVGFPVSLSIASGSETIVLDQDSTGRLWAAYEGGGNVYAAYSTSADHRTWATPGVVLRSGLNDDDVASVVRFGGDRLGVFWSDQNRWEFGFRYHQDGSAPDAWSSVEIVRPGVGNSDDHLNLAVADDGTLYAITKDVDNEFAVHRRSTGGTWTTKTNITGGQTGTRPVIMVTADGAKLYALYTCWDCGTDPIQYRSGSASTLSFGSATTFISGANAMNDVTDMKQVLPVGSLIAIASGGGNAYWNGWGDPPAGNGFGSSSDGGSSEPPPPPPPPPPPGPPAAVTALAATRQAPPGVVASFLFDELDGEKALNGADLLPQGTLGATGPDSAEPTRVPGVSGGALRFDGSNDYVEVPHEAKLDFGASFTLEAWVRRLTTGTVDVILSKEGAGRNYRLRVTSDDVLELAWRSAGGSSRATLGTRPLRDTAWHHVAAVHDHVLGQDRLYIDGGLDQLRSDTALPGPCSDPLRIGCRSASGRLREFFPGDIDLVRVASRALYDADFTPPTSFESGVAVPYVLLAWEAPTSGGTATGYHVYRSSNAEPWERLTAEPIATRLFADVAATDGVLRYRVGALNSLGETGALSDSVSVTFGNGPTLPRPPAAARARVSRAWMPAPGSVRLGFDEGVGSTAADSSGNGLDAVLGTSTTGDSYEPAWIDGVVGGGLRFDGLNDFASVPDAAVLRCAGSFTLEAWIRRVDNGRYSVVLAKETSSARNYRLSCTDAGRLELQWRNTAGSTQLVTSVAPLAAGEWHHVAGVFEAAAAENRLYVDGQPAGRAAATGTPETSDAKLRLGGRQSSSSIRDVFAGDLDLVRVAPQALYAGAFTPPQRFAGQAQIQHHLDWDAAQPGSARLMSYLVERSRQGGAWERVAEIPAAGLQTVVPAPDDAPVCYRVTTLDRLGLASPGAAGRCLYAKETQPSLQPAKATPAAPGLGLSVGPNPFNPSTTIAFRLQEPTPVTARLFDVGGHCVRTLAHGSLPAGDHRLVWDGRDGHGAALPSGLYFLLLQAGPESQRAKLVLAK